MCPELLPTSAMQFLLFVYERKSNIYAVAVFLLSFRFIITNQNKNSYIKANTWIAYVAFTFYLVFHRVVRIFNKDKVKVSKIIFSFYRYMYQLLVIGSRQLIW